MSQSHVSYSCGSCGYPLNLTDSEYQKSKKKGQVSFLAVDLSRFTQVDEVKWLPFYYRWKSKLLCRKCGVHIGYAYGHSPALCGFDSAASSSPVYNKFTVKIQALQPSEHC